MPTRTATCFCLSLRGAKRRGNPFSCGRTKRKAILWANTESVTNLPKQQPTCPVSLRRRGLPHQCAHWFAMTCRNLPGVCGCKNVVHNDMLKTGTRLRMHGRGARWHLPHCHCEERSDAAIRSPCGSTKPKSNPLGEYEKRDGFPLGKRSCPRGQLHVSACHCEERSDVAIRSPCGSTKPKSNTLGEYGKRNEFA